MLIKVNNRLHSFGRIQSITKVSDGKYVIVATHGTYRVEGGRKLGGTRSDWFVEGGQIVGHLNVASVAAAAKLIDNI
jgi:hypothetical protein